MSKKKRKKKKKVVSLQSGVFSPESYQFPLIKRNVNQLWRWDTLEDVETKNKEDNTSS